MNSVQKVISLSSANIKPLKQNTDTPVPQVPVTSTNPSDTFTPSFKGMTKNYSSLKKTTPIENVKNTFNKLSKTAVLVTGLLLAGAPFGIKAISNATTGIEYKDENTNLLNSENTIQIKDDKPKTASKSIDKKRTTKYNSNTEVAKDAKDVVKQRVEMNDEKFDVLTEIPAATESAEKAILDAYTDVTSAQAVSKNDFANVVLQYKYLGTNDNLNALADFLIGSGLSAEELREKYNLKAEFTSESMIDGDTVSQRFKNLLKQEFLGDLKPVKERTMDEMAESLTNVSVGEENKLQITPDALSIGLPEDTAVNLAIPAVLTDTNIAKYKENLTILKKAPSGENVLDVMEHNREGSKRAIEIPTTLERKILADLTVDKVKEAKLSEIDSIFNKYSSIKLEGLTGVAKRNAMIEQTKLKKDIAQRMGISDNDIDYSQVDINDLKAIYGTEKIIQDRENAKVAITEVIKSMGDKNFPTAGDIQEKVSFIDENILNEVNSVIPQVEGRILNANTDMAKNDAEITRLQTLINDKKKQLTEQVRESTNAKSQKNELRTTIAKLEQQVLDLRLANAYIQENLNMLKAIQTKLNNIKSASIKARDFLASYKTALDELEAFDKKSAPVETGKIGKQDNKAQKKFDTHNKQATKNIQSDKIISESRRESSNKKLDNYNNVELVKVATDNYKQVEDVQVKFLNKQEIVQ